MDVRRSVVDCIVCAVWTRSVKRNKLVDYVIVSFIRGLTIDGLKVVVQCRYWFISSVVVIEESEYRCQGRLRWYAYTWQRIAILLG